MMDRYAVWHDLFAPAPRVWNVVDRQNGGYDRETGARYVASCPDPDMAQRIADLLNEGPQVEKLTQEIDDLNAHMESVVHDIHDSYSL